MRYFRVRNWEKFQQYKDRDPKWIKLYRSLNRNYDWSQLTEVERAHLIGIWLLAAELDNKIPYDPTWIKSQICAQSQVKLDQLLTLGFLELYESVQDCTQRLYVETETETETETERETPHTPLGGSVSPNGFDEFWNAYPRKIGKGAAHKSWKKLKPSQSLKAKILEAVERQRGSPNWTRDNGRYIPNPSTWLNQERWDDEPDSTNRPGEHGDGTVPFS